MGTSKSSSGPGKGVNLVPEWLDVPPGAPPVLPPQTAPANPTTPPNGAPPPIPPTLPLAPAAPGTSIPRRFNDARRAFGDFIRSGDRRRLQSGLGHYVGKGYRGSRAASARMGQAATSAGRAYDVLTGVASGTATPERLGFNPAALAGGPLDDIIDALVDAICRNDTTLDDNAGRIAVNEALSEVLDENPGLDPLLMSAEYAEEVWLRTLSYHVFDDIMHDLGGRLQAAAAGDHVLFNDRCFEIKGFIRESYRDQLGRLAAAGQRLASATIMQMGRQLNAMVFDVYGGWLE